MDFSGLLCYVAHVPLAHDLCAELCLCRIFLEKIGTKFESESQRVVNHLFHHFQPYNQIPITIHGFNLRSMHPRSTHPDHLSHLNHNLHDLIVGANRGCESWVRIVGANRGCGPWVRTVGADRGL